MRVAACGHLEDHALPNEVGVRPGATVLLAEDEPLIALDTQAELQALGVEVVWVRTLADGVDAAGAGSFHAALLDLRLGDDSSVPLAELLADKGVPVAFLTGYQGNAMPAAFQDAPVLRKPFTPAQLRDLLGSLLRPG
jgi:DNA-binding response OmpR family regulator